MHHKLHKLHKLLHVIDMQEARLERLEYCFPGIWSERPVFKSIDHAPGWDPLLWETLRKARDIAPSFKLVQIKEKCGTLRIYMERGSVPEGKEDEVRRILIEAGGISSLVCEVCGFTGKIDSSRRWRKTLCIEHRALF